jgi:hypothetical protein
MIFLLCWYTVGGVGRIERLACMPEGPEQLTIDHYCTITVHNLHIHIHRAYFSLFIGAPCSGTDICNSSNAKHNI